MEQRLAYRVFELRERDDVEAFVLLPELLQALQRISEEVLDLRRKKRMRGAEDVSNQAWQIARMLSVFVVSPDSQFLHQPKARQNVFFPQTSVWLRLCSIWQRGQCMRTCRRR